MTENSRNVVTREEFRKELAELLDEDPEELRARVESIELGPPWEAEVVNVEDTDQ